MAAQYGPTDSGIYAGVNEYGQGGWVKETSFPNGGQSEKGKGNPLLQYLQHFIFGYKNFLLYFFMCFV